MNNVSNFSEQPDWHKILKTKDSAQSFLSKRITDLAGKLEFQKFSYEKTNLLHRIKWVAQIVFQALRVIVFFILKTCSFKSKKIERRYLIKLSDATLRLASLTFRFKCANELLISSYNSHNLKASNLYLKRDITMDGKPFDTLYFWGKCHGMCTLFNLLYLKAQETFPSMPAGEIIMKIGSLFKEGAPPEASILQDWQCGDAEKSAELFSMLSKDFKKYYETSSHKREYKNWTISAKQAKEANHAIGPLNKLKIGTPYHIGTRVYGLHANLLIRTADKEFYWFDPNIGLSVFKGEKGMQRLPKMLGYEKKAEKMIEREKKAKNWENELEKDFKKDHLLTPKEINILGNIFNLLKMKKNGKTLKKS